MSRSDYKTPVSDLLTYGSCCEVDRRATSEQSKQIVNKILAAGPEEVGRVDLAQFRQRIEPATWPDYLEELGLTPAHVPELIRMVTDDDLSWADGESTEIWAPIHAWRCLGLLRADEAVDPLIGLLGDEDADWLLEEIPWVLALIGERAIAPTTLYLANRRKPEWCRTAMVSTLEYIAVLHPELKERCIGKIASQLADYAHNSESLNGSLVCSLVELKATSKASLMSRAYGAERVDDTICGNWPQAQIDLGIATKDDFTREELASYDFMWVHESELAREKKALSLGLPDELPDELPDRLPDQQSEETMPSGKTVQGFGEKSNSAKGNKKKAKKKKR